MHSLSKMILVIIVVVVIEDELSNASRAATINDYVSGTYTLTGFRQAGVPGENYELAGPIAVDNGSLNLSATGQVSIAINGHVYGDPNAVTGSRTWFAFSGTYRVIDITNEPVFFPGSPGGYGHEYDQGFGMLLPPGIKIGMTNPFITDMPATLSFTGNQLTSIFAGDSVWTPVIAPKPLPSFSSIINGNAWSPIPDVTGKGSMGAQLSIPSSYGLTSQQVAHLGGYDHFNFLQKITSFYYNGEARDYISPFGVSLIGRPTGIDPLLGGNLGSLSDNYDPYWDEVSCTLCSSKYKYDFGENQTLFRDSPNFKEAGWSADFQTQLIGVRADHSYDILTDTLGDAGLTFRWKYTQTTSIFGCLFPGDPCGETAVLRNIDPLLGGGGDVEFLGFGYGNLTSNTNVPEPSTSLLFLSGLSGLGIWRRIKVMNN